MQLCCASMQLMHLSCASDIITLSFCSVSWCFDFVTVITATAAYTSDHSVVLW